MPAPTITTSAVWLLPATAGQYSPSAGPIRLLRGTGLTGIRAAIPAGLVPVAAAASTDRARPHCRPWHGPMPALVAAFTPLTSLRPVRAAWRMLPAVTPSQRQTIVA